MFKFRGIWKKTKYLWRKNCRDVFLANVQGSYNSIGIFIYCFAPSDKFTQGTWNCGVFVHRINYSEEKNIFFKLLPDMFYSLPYVIVEFTLRNRVKSCLMFVIFNWLTICRIQSNVERLIQLWYVIQQKRG